jgi:hypothetical protein
MISNGKHYATAAGGGEGIPAPSPQDQDVILEAWREVLGQVLHERDNDWKQQLRAIKAESRAAIAELRANAADIRSTTEATIAERLAQIHQPADGREGPRGEPGLQGEAGPPGKIESVHGYVDGAVHYRGDIVTHHGSTYQARCDIAREPPHEDWICVARAGVDGKDGRDGCSLNVRGTFKAGESYRAFDIVALNGGSFIARRDDPGDCPGEGWQLMLMPGKRGQQGPRGERGPAGPAGPAIKSWQIDWERYQATPLMSDGSEGSTLELRPLFEQFLMEALSSQRA